VYEWNVQRQMTAIRVAEAAGHVSREALERDIFAREYLVKRPILQALEPPAASSHPSSSSTSWIARTSLSRRTSSRCSPISR
jgi:hypothetical protein